MTTTVYIPVDTGPMHRPFDLLDRILPSFSSSSSFSAPIYILFDDEHSSPTRPPSIRPPPLPRLLIFYAISELDTDTWKETSRK